MSHLMSHPIKWHTEPTTQLAFTHIVDLGEVNDEVFPSLAAAGEVCVVTGCTEDARDDKSDQIKYDIVPVAELMAYIGQCQRKAGSDVFMMSAYPAKNMKQARLKIKRLDSATTGGQHGYQAKMLWNPPKRVA